MADSTQHLLQRAFAHHQAGRHSEAEPLYREILSRNPGDPNALHLLGVLAQEAGRNEEAVDLIKRAIQAFPFGPAFHNNLANALKALGRLEEARIAYLEALRLQPDYTEAQSSLGLVLHALKRWDEAVAVFSAALRQRPNHPTVLNNLGVSLNLMGRLEEAAAAFRQSLAAHPDQPETHNNLGNVLYELGDVEGAMAHSRQALELRPGYTGAHSTLLLRLNYEPDLGSQELFEAHKEWSRVHETPHLARTRDFHVDLAPGRPLRVGYVSPDFRRHSVAAFFEPLLAAHDRTRVEVHCYSQVAHPDDITRRLCSLSDHWLKVVGLSDDALAEVIQQDRIDVLVDLAGHTANNRLPLFARRPAPVQVTWLGYPNTTGMQAFSARFTDEVADPQGAEALHSEPLFRLPRGFLCYGPPSGAPPVAPLPAHRQGHFTFGSFNSLLKVNPGVITAWAEILKRTPGSKLVLKGMLQRDGANRQRFERAFAEIGIDPDRLELAPAVPEFRDHLATYNQVDLALDPFPYNGTTTTCEALWMGVPTLTLRGDRHAGRVGASILTRVGLESFIAEDLDSYIQSAVAWTGRLGELAGIRAGLRERMAASDLCDARGFAAQVENAFEALWKQWENVRDQRSAPPSA
ncbi:MAG: tetratricopeptide repeat protein [Holophagaceae bacterium]|nr:tetratricopeptide repeat protein [Holophagaceae bacterium]